MAEPQSLAERVRANLEKEGGAAAPEPTGSLAERVLANLSGDQGFTPAPDVGEYEAPFQKSEALRETEIPRRGLLGYAMLPFEKAGDIGAAGIQAIRGKPIKSLEGARQELLSDIRGTEGSTAREIAARAADFALTTAPAIVASRIGKKTAFGRKAATPVEEGGLGEITGSFRPTLKVPGVTRLVETPGKLSDEALSDFVAKRRTPRTTDEIRADLRAKYPHVDNETLHQWVREEIDLDAKYGRSDVEVPQAKPSVSYETETKTVAAEKPLSFAERARRGYTSVTGIPMPTALNKLAGSAVAPLIDLAEKGLTKLAKTGPAQALGRASAAIFGTPHPDPIIREMQRRSRILQGAEPESAERIRMETSVIDSLKKKALESSGMEPEQFDAAIMTMAEEMHLPGTDAAKLAERFPAMRDLAKHLRFLGEMGRRPLTGMLQSPLLGEFEMAQVGAAAKAGLEKAEERIQASEKLKGEIREKLKGTKVVDAHGNPVRVYHGTMGTFEELDPKRAYGESLYGPGGYTTENPEVSSGYALGDPASVIRKYTEQYNSRAEMEAGVAKETAKEDTVASGSPTRLEGDRFEVEFITRRRPSNVRPMYLNIKNPLDLDARLDPAFGQALIDKLGLQHYSEELLSPMKIGGETIPRDVKDLYRDAAEYVGKPELNDAIKSLGYDGMTHIGGNIWGAGKIRHRVWIFFDKDQVVPSVRPTVRALTQEQILDNLLKANAEMSKSVTYKTLGRAHVARMTTDEGARVFGIKARRDQGGGKWEREVDMTLTDPNSKARLLWPELSIPEINELVQRGKLPGFEGIVANGPIFEADPVKATVAQMLWEGRLQERAQFLKILGRDFGRELGSFGETKYEALKNAEKRGYEELPLPKRAEVRLALDPAARRARAGLEAEGLWKEQILLPRAIGRHLRGTLLWADPDGWMAKVGASMRYYDALQGVWISATLNPYLFPSTSVRNMLQEGGASISGGTRPSMFGLSGKLITDKEDPFAYALKYEKKMGRMPEDVANRVRAEDPYIGSEEARATQPNHDEMAARYRSPQEGGAQGDGSFLIWDDDPRTGHAVQRRVSILELRQLAIRSGQLRLGSMNRIRSGINEDENAAAEHSALRYMRSVFGEPDQDAFPARMVPDPLRRVHRQVKRWQVEFGEELPRVAQWLEGVLHRNLTPAESARWTNWYHVDMRRPMTFTERAVLRRLMPFYRWSRFNIPASLRIALTQPWIPVMTMKMFDVLSSGTAEKLLDAKSIAKWMRDHGGFFPTGVGQMDDGRDYIEWRTPNGSFSTMDLLDWFGSPEEATQTMVRSLSPIVRTVAASIASQIGGTRINPKTLRESTPGSTVYWGMKMPTAVAEFLDNWRIANRIDHWVTERKDQVPKDWPQMLEEWASPFADIRTIPEVTRRQNANMLKAILMEMDIDRAREQSRLKGRGATDAQLREAYREWAEKKKQTILEINGK